MAMRGELDAARREKQMLVFQYQQLEYSKHQQDAEVAQLRETARRSDHMAQNVDKQKEDYDRRLRQAEDTCQSLERDVRAARRERDEHQETADRLRREIASQDRGDSAALAEKRKDVARIEELQDEAGRAREEQLRLNLEVRRLLEVAGRLEAENARLSDQNEELQRNSTDVEGEIDRMDALNRALQQVVEEKEVQVAAQQQYETEFDRRVTAMLDERDELVAQGAREKETLLLKVEELQEELGHSRKGAGSHSEVQELTMVLKAKQLEIEDLVDRSEELEEELARRNQELEALRLRAHVGAAPGAGAGGPGTGVAQPPLSKEDVSTIDQYERRLAAFKTDAVEKDERILSLDNKLEEFARGLGAEGLLAQNHKLERECIEMSNQLGEAKRDLSQYLSEAASIVYENDLLRSIANVKPDQLDLHDYKLKEKVTSSKAVALQRQLEREVAELEDERAKLKRRMRQMSELAAEKVSILHDLLPEQMLQLEEIAASMRRGKLELPMTDESHQLRKEKEALEKRLAEKDREVADHVDKRVDELLQRTGTAKELETRAAALEQENTGLKAMNEALQKGTLERVQQLIGSSDTVGQLPPEFMELTQQQFRLLEQQAQAQSQMLLEQQAQAQSQMQQQFQGLQGMQAQLMEATDKPPTRPGHDKATGPSMPPTPAAGALAKSMPTSPNMSGILRTGNFGPLTTPGIKLATGGSGFPTMGFLGPALLQQIPGMPPMAWSSSINAAVQLPRELAEGSKETTCALYCQVVEALEELARERELRSGLSEEVQVYSQKFDRLLAEQEVLYKDYFRQRGVWSDEKRGFEQRICELNDLLGDTRKKLDDQTKQNTDLQRIISNDVSAAQWKGELIAAMARIAALEQNESVLARRYESAKQDHTLVKCAFESLEKDFSERERFFKERLSRTVLWKKRTANALRIARRRLQAMVPHTDFERLQQELAISKRRELDLVRRQSELTVGNAQKEDRLREFADQQERCLHLENLMRETDQEFTVLRRRLQAHEPRFAAECALFGRITIELQRKLGLVGHWDTVVRAVAAQAAAGGYEPGRPAGAGAGDGPTIPNVEALLDEKLRKLDSNNDGFITLRDLASFFESLAIPLGEGELQGLAEGLHVVPPVQPTHTTPASGVVVTRDSILDAETVMKANVSILAVVGRFRLFGLKPLEPEDLFWAAVQAAMLKRQLNCSQMLKTGFCVLRSAEGYIGAHDVLRVLANCEIPAERLPIRGLRSVLGWLGADARLLDQEAPLETLPSPGDPREAEVRTRLMRLRLVYHDFAELFEKRTDHALQVLRPPVAVEPSSALVPEAPGRTEQAVALQTYVAESREAAANRRCVVLEQETRAKARTVRELQRQVGELEALAQRLEGEIHEEKGRSVELKGKLDGMLPRTEVEPKLKRLEELQFEVQQSRLALQQAKDMMRVCAAQAENYEQLVKRRQQELRHLQDTVKMLQSTDEVSNAVGKLQYRLLLSQWEKSNLQKQLQAATQELRQARASLLENEEEIEKEKHEWHEEEEALQHRLVDAREMTEKYKEQATASLPIDKARELSAKIEQMASRKTELEERLGEVRRQLHRNQTETEEYKLRAEQAKELMEELGACGADDGGAGGEAPRQRLVEMAKKLADAKLLELRHKRDLEVSVEEHERLKHARNADEKEIERLQKEVASSETRLAVEEERWRERILEVQRAVLSGESVGPASTVGGNPGSAQSRRPGPSGIRRGSFGSAAAVANLEQLSDRLLEKDTRITSLEEALEKAKADKEHAVANERLQVRQLEVELNLVSQGDTMRLRQTLRAEHEAEMKQIAEAAKESVSTLQTLLDQAEQRVAERDAEIQRVLQAKREASDKHVAETIELTQEIARCRQERHQAVTFDTHARGSTDMLRKLEDSFAHHKLDASFASDGGQPNATAEERHLAEMRHQQILQEIVTKEAEMEMQREAYDEQLKKCQAEAMKQRRHFEDAYRDLESRYRDLESRYQDLESRYRDNESRFHTREVELLQQIDLVNVQKDHGIETAQEESRRHQGLVEHHVKSADDYRLAHERARADADRLHAELEAEREKFKESALRKKLAVLHRRLATKEEEIGKFKDAVEQMKATVVQLTTERSKQEADCALAQRAESDARRRLSSQEERLQGLKEHVARLTLHLQDQRAQGAHEAARTADRNSHDQELEKLLDEASARLAERSEEARKAEDARLLWEQRAKEAEHTLASERLVFRGEVRAAQEDARTAVDAIVLERDQLAARVQGLEATVASMQAAGPEPHVRTTDLHGRPRRDQHVREQLQAQVKDLTSRVESRGGLSPSRGGRGSASPVGSRSQSPHQPLQSHHLIAQVMELTTRCNQLEVEAAASRAKFVRLEQDNDDLRLKLAAGEGGAAPEEVEQLRSSADLLGTYSRGLAAELDAERARCKVLAEQGRAYACQLQEQQQSHVSALQRLEAERKSAGAATHGRAATVGTSDAAALVTAQAKIAGLQGQLENIMQENVQLRRGVVDSVTENTDATSLRQQVESLMRENVDLRRGVAVQQDTAEMGQRLAEQQTRLEELMRENVDLRRNASTIPTNAGAPALTRQAEQLQVKVDELMRENVMLRRGGAGGLAAAGQEDANILARRLDEMKVKLENLMQENVQLRRTGQVGAAIPDSDRNSTAAELVSARRQLADMKARVDELLNENVHLQRARASSPSSPSRATIPGSLGLGVPGGSGELAHVRRLHDENLAQRRVLELMLAHTALAGADAGAAFAPLVEECQRLHRRIGELSDNNVVLRLRLSGTADTSFEGGLLPIPAAEPGSLDEAREANVVLRARLEAYASDHAASARRIQEMARRVEELVAENVELQRVGRRGVGDNLSRGPSTSEVEEHWRARERAEAELECAERGRRNASELLRVQTARVAELEADRDALRQKLHESRVREFALSRQGLTTVAPGGNGVGAAAGTTDDGANQNYLLEKVESLENENDQLRRWAERTQHSGSEAITRDHATLKADHAALQEGLERLAVQNRELSREVEELKYAAARQMDTQSEREKRDQAEVQRLASACEQLTKNNARLNELSDILPERRLEILDAAKRRVEEAGVTFLQILKAIDSQRDGRLSFRIIEAAIRKLPLQLPSGGGLSVALAESTRPFLDNNDSICYIDWLSHLTTVPVAFAPVAVATNASNGSKDGSIRSPRSQALGNVQTMGVIDEAQQLRGFSLRAGFAAIDQDEDGLVSRDALQRAFGAFFEFLKAEEIKVLITMLFDVGGSGPISWMDCVWQLDLAFITSRGHVDALQSMRKHAKGGHASRGFSGTPGVPTGAFNPLEAIRDYVRRRAAAGEAAPLRRIFNTFDPKRTGFVTKRAFRTMLHQEAGFAQLRDEEFDCLFAAMDTDDDEALTLREFERAVTGEDSLQQVTDMLLRLSKALRREGISIGDLIKMFDADASGGLDREALARMFSRLNYRLSEGELDSLMDELDSNGNGAVSAEELRVRVEAALCADIVDEFKGHLVRIGISPLDAFLEADVDNSGTLTWPEFESLFLGKYHINMPRDRLRGLFDVFDMDSSGAISYREFLKRCGLRRANPTEDLGREYLPRGNGAQWGEASFATMKRAIVRSKRDDEGFSLAARRLLSEFDGRETGTLTAAQLRRVLGALGIDAEQQEAERLCDFVRERDPRGDVRGARGGTQPKRPPRGTQQGPQRSSSASGARDVRIDAVLARLEAIHVPEEEEAGIRLQSRPAVEALRSALHRRGLSIVAMLADLDPMQHGRVLFEAFSITCTRMQLGLAAKDLQQLRIALRPGERGLFATRDLLSLVRSAEEASQQGGGETGGLGGNVAGGCVDAGALEGLPALSQAPTALVSSASRRRGRSAGVPEGLVRQQQSAEQDWSARDVRHRKQVEALSTSLRQAEEERTRLQREVNELRVQATEAAVSTERTEAIGTTYGKGDTGPRSLQVLLSAGDGAVPVVKDLRLEVRGTRELREKLFCAETELEETRRKLDIEARAEIERERHGAAQLRREVEERERLIADLTFDLRRARAAAGDSDWAQREEEYMRLSVQSRKLEEELSARKRAEAELADKLLEQEHQCMELRFDKEQACVRCGRLENRLLEVELLLSDTSSERGGAAPVAPAAGGGGTASRKERSLEQVIEGLERVISQLKAENQKLKSELDGKREDRRHRGEVERLRKKIVALEGELGAQDRQRRRTGHEFHKGALEVGRARAARTAAKAELEQKDLQIAALEEQLRRLSHEGDSVSAVRQAGGDDNGAGNGGDWDGGDSTAGGDAERLRKELRELCGAREADTAALDEAQRALREAELTERRYLEVARENKRLRADLSALQDEGFWEEIEALQARSDEGTGLLRESRETIEGLLAAFPSVNPPESLLARIDVFMSAAAAA